MVTTEARAKINLSLGIFGRRDDGYHELETVMQSVALSDTVSVLEAPRGISLEIFPPVVPADASNLAWRAAELFLRAQKISGGARITIEKRIPVAAGLAGGSADASAVLVSMNRLFGTGLSSVELASIGAAIGSDVPFCVYGGTMLATGRGEILTPLPFIGHCHIVLAKPPVSVSTPWAYEEYDKKIRYTLTTDAVILARTMDAVVSAPRVYEEDDVKAAKRWHRLTGVSTPRVYEECDRAKGGRGKDSRMLVEALSSGDFHGAMKSCFNALESVVAAKYPEIYDYEKIFYESGAVLSMMSGSGPTVFSVFETDEAALFAARRMKEVRPEAEVFVTRSAERNRDE